MKKGQILWERKLNKEFPPLLTIEEELGLERVDVDDFAVEVDYDGKVFSKEVVSAMLESASPRRSELIVSRYFEDKTLKEIAKDIDRSVTTVRQQLSKGIRETRQKLNAME
jgi:RNA polymerase sigma factor (sigma-70 family)